MVLTQFEMEERIPIATAAVLWELCFWSESMDGVDLVLILQLEMGQPIPNVTAELL